MKQAQPPISWDDFEQVDLRVGTIMEAQIFPEANKPAYKLLVDFGPPIGILPSSAQITTNYTPEELFGKQVLAVVNFPPKQIGPFISRCLVTGVLDKNGGVVLVGPLNKVPNGTKLH